MLVVNQRRKFCYEDSWLLKSRLRLGKHVKSPLLPYQLDRTLVGLTRQLQSEPDVTRRNRCENLVQGTTLNLVSPTINMLLGRCSNIGLWTRVMAGTLPCLWIQFARRTKFQTRLKCQGRSVALHPNLTGTVGSWVFVYNTEAVLIKSHLMLWPLYLHRAGRSLGHASKPRSYSTPVLCFLFLSSRQSWGAAVYFIIHRRNLGHLIVNPAGLGLSLTCCSVEFRIKILKFDFYLKV